MLPVFGIAAPSSGEQGVRLCCFWHLALSAWSLLLLAPPLAWAMCLDCVAVFVVVLLPCWLRKILNGVGSLVLLHPCTLCFLA